MNLDHQLPTQDSMKKTNEKGPAAQYKTKLQKLLNYYRINWLPTLFIIGVTVFIWHKILDQAFLGEGYYYFDRQQKFINEEGRITDIWQLDLFARLLFNLLPVIFKDNITAYFAFQLGVMFILYLTFFCTVQFFTKNKFISLTACILLITSYTGSFEMLGIGNYQRFAQRVPNIIVEFLALIQLGRYIEYKKINSYLFSISLFSGSVFMSHFSTFLLPLFLTYPLVWVFLQKNKVLSLIRGTAIATSFALANFLIINKGFHTPQTNLVEFAKSNPGVITQQILLQLTNIIFPPALIDKVASVAQPYNVALILLLAPVLLLFVWGLILIRKEHVRLVAIYITCLLAIPAILFLNLYVGKVNAIHNIGGYKYYFTPSFYVDQPDVITSVKGDRYYFVPSFFIALAFAILIWLLFAKKTQRGHQQNREFIPAVYKIVTTILLVIYIFYNSQIIWAKMDQLKPISDEMKAYILYTESISHNFNENTTIVVPPTFIWPSPFIRTFYGHPDMQFRALKSGWEKEIAQESKNDTIVLDYDYKNRKFIDLTTKYRQEKNDNKP